MVSQRPWVHGSLCKLSKSVFQILIADQFSSTLSMFCCVQLQCSMASISFFFGWFCGAVDDSTVSSDHFCFMKLISPLLTLSSAGTTDNNVWSILHCSWVYLQVSVLGADAIFSACLYCYKRLSHFLLLLTFSKSTNKSWSMLQKAFLKRMTRSFWKARNHQAAYGESTTVVAVTFQTPLSHVLSVQRRPWLVWFTISLPPFRAWTLQQ